MQLRTISQFIVSTKSIVTALAASLVSPQAVMREVKVTCFAIGVEPIINTSLRKVEEAQAADEGWPTIRPLPALLQGTRVRIELTLVVVRFDSGLNRESRTSAVSLQLDCAALVRPARPAMRSSHLEPVVSFHAHRVPSRASPSALPRPGTLLLRLGRRKLRALQPALLGGGLILRLVLIIIRIFIVVFGFIVI